MRKYAHYLCIFFTLFGFLPIFSYASVYGYIISSSNLTSDQYSPISLGNTINVPGDYATIQQAVNAARSGETIYVGTGTYHENVVVSKANLTLLGHGANDTIIENGLVIEADNVIVSRFTFENAVIGILLDHVTNCTVFDNLATKNKFGILIQFSHNCSFYRNRAINNEHNIHLDYSPNNKFTENVMQSEAYYNFGLTGRFLEDYIQEIDTSNIVNGKAIYYIANTMNLTIDRASYPNLGDLIIVNSSKMIVRDLTISNNLDGILLAYVSDSIVQNITSINNKVGINLSFSSNCTASDSVVTYDMYYGILLTGSSMCRVYGNNVTGNYEGIYLTGSSNNTIQGNTIRNNDQYQIYLDYAYDNVIYHNNIINDTSFQPYVFSNNSTRNKFDNGVEGNFWSDYAGLDTDKNGIGDTEVPFEQLDYHPLIGSINYFDVTKEKTVYAVEVISNGNLDGLQFSEHQKSLTFNVSTSRTAGFTRITIPQALLERPYTIWIDNSQPLFLNQKSNGNYTQLCFTYLGGFHQIEIACNSSLPVAVAGPNQNVFENTEVKFDGSKSRSVQTITSYEWYYGDGTAGFGMTATHEYEKSGNYTVNLLVKDSLGNIDVGRCIVTVKASTQLSNQDAFLTGPLFTLVSLVIVVVEITVATIIAGIILRSRKNKNSRVKSAP